MTTGTLMLLDTAGHQNLAECLSEEKVNPEAQLCVALQRRRRKALAPRKKLALAPNAYEGESTPQENMM